MKWFTRLKNNRFFQFIASVKMAVPLMVALALIVAVGTVIESRYNAQVAGLLVYRSGWFEWLLILLGVNVLASALIRFPYQQKHLGFVITHLGLVVLLIGAVMTSELGLDGSLRVVEGQQNHIVAVSEMSLKVADAQKGTVKSYLFKRSLEPLNGKQLGFDKLRKETGLVLDRFLPFVAREQSFASAPPEAVLTGAADAVIEFTLGSSTFGNAREWLHSKERPEAQIGPTLLKVVVDTGKTKPGKPVRKKIPMHSAESLIDQITTSAAAPAAVREGAEVVIRDAQGAELKRVALTSFRKKPVTINQVKISFSKVFEQALVVEGKLVDKGERGANPALEVKFEKGGKVTREFAFAKYPGFSMNQAGSAIGLRVDYVLPELGEVATAAMPQGHPAVGAAAPEPGHEGHDHGPTSQNAPNGESGRIEFHVLAGQNAHDDHDEKAGTPVRLEFYKGDKLLSKKNVRVGESTETPWMGMTLVVDSLIPNAVAVDQVRPVDMIPRGSLPDSAIYVRAEAGQAKEGVWLVEGDYKTLRSGDQSYELYYGVDSVELPFHIFLQKFEKVDYPGTETPMSFQSTVQVNGEGNPILIKMNEPLKVAGYTLYQSSYEIGNGPTASIFSVNKDPGRSVKYLGSLILCLGIVLFSIMKSEWFRNRQKTAKEGAR
ncbi:MAG TPA: hypothetical protein DCS07_16625 [Bdellovibrionales bacterium]|nr:MAG: hypothetical protein A2X97_11200 [Bdellovibrionales bacterium GWA1_52_35]OFZ42302.1 MAG: hypothetical protein A2070_05460 [Bdellovibrionales bacterium GWC1_52_8]HAR44231.1 hypothetical protein [Bdellovibrionales bacterium]HCM39199.1 hypothetical protein [Bdellovibrionales bacterium]